MYSFATKLSQKIAVMGHKHVKALQKINTQYILVWLVVIY